MFDSLKLYYRLIKRSPVGKRNYFSLIRNYLPWAKTISKGKSSISDGMPWMTIDAIRFLKNNLTKDMKVFEYGSGGSSIFFSRLSAEVISTEHEKEWFDSVNEKLKSMNLNNWRGIFNPPQTASSGSTDNPEDPRNYSTSDKATINFSFENYVKSIDQFPDGYFDLVVVDGRSRPACILHGIKKLKKGGLILVDNAERSHYQRVISEFITKDFKNEVDSFGPTSYSLEFTSTLIRRKL